MTGKKMLTGAILLALAGWGQVSAADVYTLDPVVVTADRTEELAMKTPAAVEVVTGEQLQELNPASMQEALKFSTGVVYQSQGPRGLSQGTMFSKIIIRGVEKGTSIFLDGVPISQQAVYNLNNVGTESVEKVEIVRGGGSVMYGSEAMGGVINIITKGVRDNKVKAAIGNYGQQSYSVSAQAADKFGITYEYNHVGKINDISAPNSKSGLYYNILDGERHNLNARYNFNDNLFFTYDYGRNMGNYMYRYNGKAGYNAGAPYTQNMYMSERHSGALHYRKNEIKADLYYTHRNMWIDKHTHKVSPARSSYKESNWLPWTKSSDRTDQTFGLNASNRWHFKKGSYLLGFDYQRDLASVYDSDSESYMGYQRNMYSVYGQLSYNFTDRTRVNLNLRETWTGEDAAGNKYSKFTPEIVLMHDLSDSAHLYAKAGKSFAMPTFKQLYGGSNIIANPGLKPQSGDHYELGFKKQFGNKASLRVALFHYKIKNFIDIESDSLEAYKAGDSDTLVYTNVDIKNTGLEVEYTHQPTDRFSYHLGFSWSHPQKYESEEGDFWHDYYGKIQINGGVSYKIGKLTSAFNFNYLAQRTRDVAPFESYKPYLFTNLNFSYQANDHFRAFLDIDNLLDRRDITTSSTSSFYTLGFNFMAGVEYKF